MAKKVLVAMSGGIDSAVAALLLKNTGFEVAAGFMRLDDTWQFRDGQKRAKEISKILKIPFYVFDFRKEFKKHIIDYFLTEQKKGFTPNPCPVCNKIMKFGLLLKKARELKMDFLATGHYACLRQSRLFRAKDKGKDQSYGLWMLSQSQIKHCLFPLCNLTKKQVRAIAKKFLLLVYDIPESQEICFIPHFKQKIGKICDKSGKVIGQHQGVVFYTFGQRKGIGLPGGPYYVLKKDIQKNILTVTKNKKDLAQKEIKIKKINWLFGAGPKLPLAVKIKIRSSHKAVKGIIKMSQKSGILKVVFAQSQLAPCPGQSCVFYLGQEVLGGGIIWE